MTIDERLIAVDATDKLQLGQVLEDIRTSLQSMELDEADTSTIIIPPNTELIGIDQSVYAQISNVLQSKRHLMLYGPPGTGKTSLAQYVAGILHSEHVLITGSSDWTSQDIIGGYHPIGGGKIEFMPGVLLLNFDKPVIIDELNRVDIDKAIGPLFTVLSGQPSTLPYFKDPQKHDERITIYPNPVPEQLDHVYAPTNNWRLITTMNSIDKASLYQMSYALSRRFGWILIDVPADLSEFIRTFIKSRGLSNVPDEPSAIPILATIWEVINKVRPIGPAPFIDVIRYCSYSKSVFDFFAPAVDEAKIVYLQGLYSFVLPMLDGILADESRGITDAIAASLSLNHSDPLYMQLLRRMSYHEL